MLPERSPTSPPIRLLSNWSPIFGNQTPRSNPIARGAPYLAAPRAGTCLEQKVGFSSNPSNNIKNKDLTAILTQERTRDGKETLNY